MNKTISKAYKFRLFPDDKSVDFLSQCFGHTRFVYNYFLNYRSESWKNHQLNVNYGDTSKLLTQLKKQDEFSWLKDIPSIPLQQKLRHLDNAFKKFFKKEAKFPRFKKRMARQSASFLTSGKTYVGEGYITISQHKKCFNIPFKMHRNFDFSKVKSFNVSKESNGAYFVSCVVEEESKLLPQKNNVIGIDLGIKDYCIDSIGQKIRPLKPLQNNLKQLRKLNKSLSRKKKNSNNFKKAKIKLSKLHCTIANQRKDFLHQVSKALINENQVICLESLKIKNMVKNRRLARNISDASWGMFVEFLEYKAKWYGRTIVKIDQFFPSSKICHVCETKNESLKLSDRKWQCELCQTIHDRDQNAAINIENEGCNVMAKKKDLKKILSLLERRDSKYCGGGVNQGVNTLLPPMKQDAHSKSIDLV